MVARERVLVMISTLVAKSTTIVFEKMVSSILFTSFCSNYFNRGNNPSSYTQGLMFSNFSMWNCDFNLAGMTNVECHEKFKRCVKSVHESGKPGFSSVCPYDLAVSTMVQGMDVVILMSQWATNR